MASSLDIKGKGIKYDDDDEPFRLEDDEDAHVAQEFRLSLIGKILNPKKQNVEKLINYMPNQWGMQDRITANDLGNGKFLFNFITEEDLLAVLRQGPFHYNYCMFVLVRWEPIVHDYYPWVIPFWVRFTGVPLHLWTVKNLRGLGGRLGVVDTLELEEGRMLIDIDTRKPLRFQKLATNLDRDEVTIKITYDLLFKHCTTCGFLTHEKEYCPEIKVVKTEGKGVFARMQRYNASYERHQTVHEPQRGDITRRLAYRDSYRNERTHGEPYARSDKIALRSRNNGYKNSGPESQGTVRDSHVMRARDERLPNRYNYAPYARKEDRHWRQKGEIATLAIKQTARGHEVSGDREMKRAAGDEGEKANGTQLQSSSHSSRLRLASKIVSPLNGNVTVRNMDAARVLSFPSETESELSLPSDAMVIGALKEMEISNQVADKSGEGSRDVDIAMDDMLDDEMLDVEQMGIRKDHKEERDVGVQKRRRGSSSSRNTHRRGVLLGISNKKFDRLRRGSPTQRPTSIHPYDEEAMLRAKAMKNMRSGHKIGGRKGDGLMSSTNSSKNKP